jgi:hypothetical protein
MEEQDEKAGWDGDDRTLIAAIEAEFEALQPAPTSSKLSIYL